MKTIRELRDLEQYGINALTGEACRVGTRILCDLTEDGERTVADLIGINYQTFNKYRTFPSSWNSKVNGKPATASFMLPHGLFDDLAIWCLVRAGCHQIIVVHDQAKDGARWEFGIHGQEGAADEDYDHLVCNYLDFGVSFRRITLNNNLPGEGTRCTHVMTGRTE